MQPIEIHLYRIKFIKPAQQRLFSSDVIPANLFRAGLSARPTIELRKNHVWHIGNVEYLESGGGRFAIGRTTKTTVEKFDAKSGNFVEELDDSGPYTFVYFDSGLGVLGISKKGRVAPNVAAIARKIEGLLSRTTDVIATGVEVRVDIIPDPEDFLKKIRSAFAIKRFRADFTGPNPIDADELFQKPLSFYCQQLHADSGNVTVKGDALDDEAVAAVAKSTAATGNSASALIQPAQGKRPVSISFRGDPAKVIVGSNDKPKDILNKIMNTYDEVRK